MNFDSSAFVSEPGLLQRLLEHAVPLDCSKGRVLFRQGENPYGLFVLRRGKAIMTLESESGAALIRTQLAPGSILGLPALMSEKPYTMSAVANRSAVVSYVTRKDFSALMLAEPKLAFGVLRVLAAEVHTTRTAISQCSLSVSQDEQSEHQMPDLVN
jgi:CRP/FNR family cyclic AMP-dependent transcriptional regulator